MRQLTPQQYDTLKAMRDDLNDFIAERDAKQKERFAESEELSKTPKWRAFRERLFGYARECRDVSIYNYTGKDGQKREVVMHPSKLPLITQVQRYVEDKYRRYGLDALYHVYQRLTERHGALAVLLPVVRDIAGLDQDIIDELSKERLITVAGNRIYPQLWFFGVEAPKAKAALAQMFSTAPQKTLEDIREMLVYAKHLISVEQQTYNDYREAQSTIDASRYRALLAAVESLPTKTEEEAKELDKFKTEITAAQSAGLLYSWFIVKSQVNKELVSSDIKRIENAMYPSSGADRLSTEDERVFSYIVSTYKPAISGDTNAFKVYESWMRELSM
ncbi:MAG: hypothetical protein AB1553_04575 [Nitrospirota bacterium]